MPLSLWPSLRRVKYQTPQGKLHSPLSPCSKSQLRVQRKKHVISVRFTPVPCPAGRRAPGQGKPPSTDKHLHSQNFMALRPATDHSSSWKAPELRPCKAERARLPARLRQLASHPSRKEKRLLSSSPFLPAPLYQPRKLVPESGPLATKWKRATGQAQVTWVQKVNS